LLAMKYRPTLAHQSERGFELIIVTLDDGSSTKNCSTPSSPARALKRKKGFLTQRRYEADKTGVF